MRGLSGATAVATSSNAAADTGVGFALDLGAHGDRVALVAPDGSRLTYAELARRVREVGERLGPQRRLVQVMAANAVEPIVTYLAALGGGHPVIVAPANDAAAAEALRSTYEPDVTLAADGREWRLDEQRDGSQHDLHPDLALLLSTSGSTGSPKVVRLSRTNVETNAAAIAEYLTIEPDDRAITSLPMHYCYGLSVIHSHLLRGACIVLSENSVVDRCFWSSFHEHGVTSFAGVPHTFELLERVGFETMELPTLRHVTQAGGRLPPRKVRRFADLAEQGGWRFFVMYGQTEATARMAYVPPDEVKEHPDTIGVPIPGGTFEIDPLPGEAHGELLYRGPNVMLGYAESPGDLALGRTVEVLRTGDLARRTPEGMYRIVGRASRFIKPFGVRIDLDAVEDLLRDTGVHAACTGTDDALVIALEGTSEDRAAVATVHSTIRARLGLPPAYVHLRHLDEIPRLDNGKPDYRAIGALPDGGRSDDAGGEPDTGAARPAPHRAATVRQLFGELLDVPDVRGSDTFVGLGGDSLSYVQASLRLEERLGFVPDQWHLTPVEELERLSPRRGGRRPWRWMETNVVLRAIAIVLIVCTHSGVFRQQGGAHLLFAVAGFNFARFQLAGSDGQERTRRHLASIARIAVPTLAMTALAMTVRDGFAMSNLVLVNNYVGDGRWWYWYVEALVQVLVLSAALFAIPAAGRLERSHPFAFPLVVTALLLVPRFAALGADLVQIPTITPHVIAWLFGIGWMAQRAATLHQRLLTVLVLAVAMPGFFDDTSRSLVVAGGILAMLWLPRLAVPTPLRLAVGTLAGASLYIYLTHFFLYAELSEARGPAVAAAASLVLGAAVWALVERWRELVVVPLRSLLRRGHTDVAWRRQQSNPSM